MPAEGVPPGAGARAAPPGPSSALSWLMQEQQAEETMGLADMVQHMRSALRDAVAEQRSVEARVQDLEAAEKCARQGLADAELQAAELFEGSQAALLLMAELERSVEASQRENLERDTQQSDDMLGWDEEVSSLASRLELLESTAPKPEEASGAAPQAVATAALASSAMLERLAEVELRVASTEVMARNQHIELEEKVDLHAGKLDQVFGAHNEQLAAQAALQAALADMGTTAQAAKIQERAEQQASAEMLASSWSGTEAALRSDLGALQAETAANLQELRAARAQTATEISTMDSEISSTVVAQFSEATRDYK